LRTIVETLSAYLEEEHDVDPSEVQSDTLLFSSGIVDSFMLVALLTFIETTFDCEVEPVDVTLENFDSLDRMAAYIESRL
jgi:acyl carrier protein